MRCDLYPTNRARRNSFIPRSSHWTTKAGVCLKTYPHPARLEEILACIEELAPLSSCFEPPAQTWALQQQLPGGHWETWRCDTEGRGSVGTVGMGRWFDLMTLEVFSNFEDFMILWPAIRVVPDAEGRQGLHLCITLTKAAEVGYPDWCGRWASGDTGTPSHPERCTRAVWRLVSQILWPSSIN